MPLAVAAAMPRHRVRVLQEQKWQRAQAGCQRGEKRDPKNFNGSDQGQTRQLEIGDRRIDRYRIVNIRESM